MGSDHFPIRINTSLSVSPHATNNISKSDNESQAFNSQIDIHNLNWVTYHDSLLEYMKEADESADAMSMYNYIMLGIGNYLDTHHPFKMYIAKPRISKPSWWDMDCSKHIALRRLALTKFKKYKTFQFYILLKKQVATTKRFLNQKKKK